MAPEQLNQGAMTFATDVYAFAMVLYQVCDTTFVITATALMLFAAVDIGLRSTLPALT